MFLMRIDFQSQPERVVGNKIHRCAGCEGTIQAGKPSIKSSGRYCGAYWKRRHHPECFKAESILNVEFSHTSDEWSPLEEIISAYPTLLERPEMDAIRTHFPRQWLKRSFPSLFQLMQAAQPKEDINASA